MRMTALTILAISVATPLAAQDQINENPQKIAPPQNDIVKLPPHNKDIWTIVPTDTGAAFYHKNSRAICDARLKDLKLVAIKDYLPDGTNSSCQYEKMTKDGLSRLTLYVYTDPRISGPSEYRGAKQAILDYNKHANLSVSEDDIETKNCFGAIVPKVAEAKLAKETKNSSEPVNQTLQMGVVMFNMDIAANGNRAAYSERTLLTVYQTGKWVVKTRVTVPAGETSSIDACRYAGLPNIALMKQIKG